MNKKYIFQNLGLILDQEDRTALSWKQPYCLPGLDFFGICLYPYGQWQLVINVFIFQVTRKGGKNKWEKAAYC